jgi:hypothetical protein
MKEEKGRSQCGLKWKSKVSEAWGVMGFYSLITGETDPSP